MFSGVALDESSIIKSHASKTLALLMDAFRATPLQTLLHGYAKPERLDRAWHARGIPWRSQPV